MRRLLLDNNLSFRLKRALEPRFEVAHVPDFGMSKSDDSQIWLFAQEEGWTIVTKDADFADRALLDGPPPQVIRLKIGNTPWPRAADALLCESAVVNAFLADPSRALLLLG